MKKLAAIFAGISLLILMPDKLSATVSRANLIGKWDCKSSAYYDWGIIYETSVTDLRADGSGYTNGTLSFLFRAAPPRTYQVMASANWTLSGNSWTTQYKSYQATQIGPNHDQNSIDLNQAVELGTISSGEVLKLNQQELVFLWEDDAISYCSKL